QTVTVSPLPNNNGFRLRMQSTGTADVPLAVEINLRPGGKLEGVKPAHNVPDGFVLDAGHATYRVGEHAVRFGPGVTAHMYTQLRGAAPKLPGLSVYITGFTPFDRIVDFEAV
ncbi:MAG TPA: hypothetical protein VES20_19130, partial [Bryobacteraceae bacterium]|nr:hypothetical protein [Bryobacteraceae bacterium]